MHPCLNVDEILRSFACELVASEAKVAAVALACCCKSFEDPVLDALWETQDQLAPLLKCFPQDIWEEEDGCFVSPLTTFTFPVFNRPIWKSFKRIPTKAEWTNSRKHAQRMRKLKMDTSANPLTPDILLVLQHRTANDHWLPRLKAFEYEEVGEAFVPFISLFLSPKTTRINIGFAGDTPIVVVASTISRFSVLCPNLEFITLSNLPRDSVITDAVSEMLLGCNRDVLEEFQVDSQLTEEAQEIIYRLPRLAGLWAVIQGPTSLPTVTLPNLTVIDLEYDHDLNWLQGFRGATLEKLEEVYFRSESGQIGDFLGAFKSVALTTSVRNTLRAFSFCTTRSWNPSYSSLLSFNQLRNLDIQFSCKDGCSSRVDDDIIVSLTGAMPKLEILRLGHAPCHTPTGITVNGLIGLACRCPRLSELCVHFQAASLFNAAASAATPSPSDDELVILPGDCALAVLEVGETPIPAESAVWIALILARVFPHIRDVLYTNQEWEDITNIIKHFRRIGTFVHRSSKVYPSHLMIHIDTPPGDAIGVGRPSGGGQA